MIVNFSLNQGDLLTDFLDPEVKTGVCSAMVITWLKRELNEELQSVTHYIDIYQFTSLQRAMVYRHSMEGTFARLFKSDNLNSIAVGTINSSNIIKKINSYIPGAFIIDFSSTSGGAHCVGLSIFNGKYKIFDPNFGQCEVEINTGSHPLVEVMRYFHKVLVSLRFHRIRVTKLQIK